MEGISHSSRPQWYSEACVACLWQDLAARDTRSSQKDGGKTTKEGSMMVPLLSRLPARYWTL